MTQGYPVDETLTVHEGEDIYRTGKWWKAIVQYHFQDRTNAPETAIYLWNNDNERGWTQKNKYVIKTLEAWKDDQAALEAVGEAPTDSEANDNFPVSDYYSVAAGETIFKTDSWWKAIVRINQKGDYETEELIVYVWQFHDEKWRRRQKYAIKDSDDWEGEKQAVARLLDESAKSGTSQPHDDATDIATSGADGPMNIESLDSKAVNHLSEDLREGW